mmetsp:Transcript_9113/g.28923  ORF Transcript_9113/g.28923 Transcript_9113/m.28923 type:complete len:294 (-) Transcript_9113:192-1073(-)
MALDLANCVHDRHASALTLRATSARPTTGLGTVATKHAAARTAAAASRPAFESAKLAASRRDEPGDEATASATSAGLLLSAEWLATSDGTTVDRCARTSAAAPAYAMRPSVVVNSSLSQCPKTSAEGVCSVATTVVPCSLATASRTWRMTSSAVVLSSPVVGSSSKTILGLDTRPSAIATRFFSPPEIPRTVSEPTRTSAHFDSPSSRNVSLTKAPDSASRSSALTLTTSRTVSAETQLRWLSLETSVAACLFAALAGTPSYKMRPLITPDFRCTASSSRRLDIHGPLRPMQA